MFSLLLVASLLFPLDPVLPNTPRRIEIANPLSEVRINGVLQNCESIVYPVNHPDVIANIEVVCDARGIDGQFDLYLGHLGMDEKGDLKLLSPSVLNSLLLVVHEKTHIAYGAPEEGWAEAPQRAGFREPFSFAETVKMTGLFRSGERPFLVYYHKFVTIDNEEFTLVISLESNVFPCQQRQGEDERLCFLYNRLFGLD